jgi:hypothetical protein
VLFISESEKPLFNEEIIRLPDQFEQRAAIQNDRRPSKPALGMWIRR